MCNRWEKRIYAAMKRFNVTLVIVSMGLAAWFSFQAARGPVVGPVAEKSDASSIAVSAASVAPSTPHAAASAPLANRMPDDLMPLFELAEWTSVAPDPSPLAPGETLSGRQVRAFSEIKSISLPRLADLRPGDRLWLPARLGSGLLGVVNLVQKDDHGWTRVGGGIDGGKGSFSLAQNDGQWAGMIRDEARSTALVLQTTAEGTLRFVEKPLSSVRCLAVPRKRPPQGREGQEAADGAGGGGGGAVGAAAVVVPAFESLPAATHVIYLDFDGEVVTDPDWNDGFAIDAVPSVIGSGVISSALITQVCNRVAEDFRPWNISVTTSQSRYDAAGAGQRMRCIITPTNVAAPGAGGVGYVDSYSGAGVGFSSTIPAWAFTSSYYNANDIAGTISHEVGHTLGLSHDGRFDTSDPRFEEYYEGHGSGATSWGPIMGTTYDRSVSQWSKGEYANANNLEDDLAIIGRAANGFSTRPDDAANAAPGTVLPNSGTFNVSGVTTAGTDADVYAFTTAGGAVSVTATPAALAPNLDVALDLLGSDGVTVLKSANPNGPAAATLTHTVPSGTFFLVVRSSGFQTASNGYTTYGSVGEYKLTGSFPAVPDTAPIIITDPQSVTVNSGGTATFTVVALSNIGTTFQWSKDGIPIPRQTTATLKLSKVQPAAAGGYACTVTNAVGPVVSATANLTVQFKPVITQQPLTQTAPELGNVVLAVAANAVPAPAFQWQRNNVNIPGATSATLSLGPLQWPDAAKYRCIVSNSLGAVTSGTATLTISSKPFILTQPPAALLVPLNGSATISTAAAGTGRLTYQWFQNGTLLPGKTSSRLSFSRIAAGIAGTYRCDISNGLGTTSTIDCVVTVQDAPVITVPPASVTVARGARFTLRVLAVGSATLKYEWFLNGLKIPGNRSSLTLTAATDGDYHAVVTNTTGSATSATAHVTVHDAPKITVHPLTQTRAFGGSVTFTIAATGTAPLAYQWTKNKIPVPGANGDSLTLSGLSSSDLGLYACTVSNDVGTVLSKSAKLGLLTAPSITQQPVSATVDAFGKVVFSAAVSGSATIRYQWQKDGSNIPRATAKTLTLSNVQASSAGSYTLIATNSVGSATSDPAVLTVTPVGAPSVSGFFPPQGRAGHFVRVFGSHLNWTTTVQFRSPTGGIIRAAFVILSSDEVLATVPTGAATSNIEVITRGGTAATPTAFSVTSVNDTNDNFENARVIPPAGGSATGSCSFFTPQAGEPRHALAAGDPFPEDFDAVYSGWFQWTPTVTGGYYFSTAGSSFDTRVAIYTGSSLGALIPVGANDDVDPSAAIYTSRAYVYANAGTTYYIAIDGFFFDITGRGDFYDASGPYKLAVTRVPGSSTLASTATRAWISSEAETIAEDESGITLGGAAAKTTQLAWLPAEIPLGDSDVQATATFSYEAGAGQFGFVAYDDASEPLFGVNVVASTGVLQVITDAGTTETGQTITPGQPHEIAIVLDRTVGTWGITLNGAWITMDNALPVSGGGAITDLAVQWLPGGAGPSTLHVENAGITSGTP